MFLLLVLPPGANTLTDPGSGTDPARGSTVWRPYAASSPWNTPIGEHPDVHPRSASLITRIGPVLYSDPTQYTVPVYAAALGAAAVTVTGTWTDVVDDGRTVARARRPTVRVPIPAMAAGAPGSDGHVVVVDRRTGDEWGLWQARRDGDGWVATNGYHYRTGWDAAPPVGFGSRGAGLPYLAGLVRREEVDAGRIDHAVAFGFPRPSCAFTSPASKSDGPGDPDDDLPEGARLQLDPMLGEQDFDRWGLDRAGRVLARAMQEYGMIVVDVSGRPKIYLEAEQTARWDGLVDARTVSGIPLAAFRVLDHRGMVSDAGCA